MATRGAKFWTVFRLWIFDLEMFGNHIWRGVYNKESDKGFVGKKDGLFLLTLDGITNTFWNVDAG